jgi:hypothetical protein
MGQTAAVSSRSKYQFIINEDVEYRKVYRLSDEAANDLPSQHFADILP